MNTEGINQSIQELFTDMVHHDINVHRQWFTNIVENRVSLTLSSTVCGINPGIMCVLIIRGDGMSSKVLRSADVSTIPCLTLYIKCLMPLLVNKSKMLITQFVPVKL